MYVGIVALNPATILELARRHIFRDLLLLTRDRAVGLLLCMQFRSFILAVAIGTSRRVHLNKQQRNHSTISNAINLATRYCTREDEGASLLRHLAVRPRDPLGLKHHLSESKGRTPSRSFGTGKY